MTPIDTTALAELVQERIAILKQRLIRLDAVSSRWTEGEEVQRQLATWQAILARLTAAPAVPRCGAQAGTTCVHTESSDYEYWHTACGHDIVWEDGSGSKHGAIFCSRCGSRVMEVPYVEPTDDDVEPSAPQTPEGQ